MKISEAKAFIGVSLSLLTTLAVSASPIPAAEGDKSTSDQSVVSPTVVSPASDVTATTPSEESALKADGSNPEVPVSAEIVPVMTPTEAENAATKTSQTEGESTSAPVDPTILLMPVPPGQSAKPVITAQPEGPRPSVPIIPPNSDVLSAVIKKRLTGLDLEGSWPKLEKDAKEYIEFRKKQSRSRNRTTWLNWCQGRQEKNFYCELAMKRGSEKLAQALSAADADPTNSEEFDPPSRSQIPGMIQKGDLSGLRGATRAHIYGALRRFKSWEPLEKLVTKALDSNACKNIPILTALGQKAEEFFPEPRFKALSLSLYEKAISCQDPESDSIHQARYRYSLIKIWAGQCESVDPILEQLSSVRSGEFASRSLYWRAYCAKESGKKLRYTAFRSRLIKDFPLSFHALLITGRNPESFRVLGNEEPLVLFRSDKVPATTPIVRAVEVLQSLGANDLARSFLYQLEETMQESEPAFRLYVGVLMHRSGESIGQFRLLSGVFRDAPWLISQATLKLFYPLRQFDVLQKYGQRLDSYFVAALIRQESGFNERARSRAGAMGLMQLMPGTARRMERGSVSKLYNPQTNVRLGVRFFQNLVDRYSSDAELALAAYNAGPERVDEWKRRYPTDNRVLFFDLIPFKETRDYVALISRNYYWYLSLYGEGPRRSLASKPQSLIFTLFQ